MYFITIGNRRRFFPTLEAATVAADSIARRTGVIVGIEYDATRAPKH